MKKVSEIETNFKLFNPHHYLQTYYSKIGPENESLLEFYASCYKRVPQKSILLEFSGGPTIYSLITAAIKVSEIHFSDYLEENLNEVELWRNSAKNSFNWRKYIKRALEYEGLVKPTSDDISHREMTIKNKITKLYTLNALNGVPINDELTSYYDVINVNFVAESITSSYTEWRRIIANISSMLKLNGTLVMTAIKGAQYYHVGKKKFPAVSITEDMLLGTLYNLGFDKKSLRMHVIPAEVIGQDLDGFVGYTGMIFLEISKTA